MEKVGEIKHCCVWLNDSGKSMGSGLVEYKSKIVADNAKVASKVRSSGIRSPTKAVNEQ